MFVVAEIGARAFKFFWALFLFPLPHCLGNKQASVMEKALGIFHKHHSSLHLPEPRGTLHQEKLVGLLEITLTEARSGPSRDYASSAVQHSCSWWADLGCDSGFACFFTFQGTLCHANPILWWVQVQSSIFHLSSCYSCKDWSVDFQALYMLVLKQSNVLGLPLSK